MKNYDQELQSLEVWYYLFTYMSFFCPTQKLNQHYVQHKSMKNLDCEFISIDNDDMQIYEVR